MQLRLRATRPGDLPVFFEHHRDIAAAAIAGSRIRERGAFDDHWRRILADPRCIVRTVTVDGQVAGYVTTFVQHGRREIAYWIGRDHGGRGIGGTAVAAFLDQDRERPLFASVLIGNVASRAILRRCGFGLLREDTGPDGFVECVFRLD